ncbi:hypothetical protein O159_25470 [Leifsonia xyli subsp. cynodontis DSM 46306]|uniref:Uncharacterized protein n=1 Tax=Leifsonia xyli subsp. cynodontis DSM 46306 TaxID=1389489 RepID=U3PFP5_LEIXC|nr:hypothetical protein O159_25470 [Leifsonia xyli subsp. cynodontis DSM 46306]
MAGRPVALHAQPCRVPLRHRIGVTLAVIGLICGFSIVPTDCALQIGPATTVAPGGSAPQSQDKDQYLFTAATLAAPVANRESSGATDGIQSLVQIGTNESWAKLVLIVGDWPMTDANVTVMLRWMRQENGPPDWWNRNNPLNNGYGSGGGAGLGSYPDLVSAAEYCAKNLQQGYPGIVAGLQAGTNADATAAAIWASPWASSHYANGAHWSTRPVEIVQAPASAWHR